MEIISVIAVVLLFYTLVGIATLKLVLTVDVDDQELEGYEAIIIVILWPAVLWVLLMDKIEDLTIWDYLGNKLLTLLK